MEWGGAGEGRMPGSGSKAAFGQQASAVGDVGNGALIGERWERGGRGARGANTRAGACMVEGVCMWP